MLNIVKTKNCCSINVQEETERVKRFLRREMGLDLGRIKHDDPVNLTREEINSYISRFRSLDTNNKGYITVNDLRQYFKVIPTT